MKMFDLREQGNGYIYFLEGHIYLLEFKLDNVD